MIKKYKKYKKLIVIILAVLLLVAGYFAFLQEPETVAADWFDDSWLFRQIISVTNSGSAQTDFQVQLSIDTATLITATKMQSDCDDIRLTDLNGKLLSYWLEPNTCNTSATKVWVKMPSIPAAIGAGIYFYYGNSAANSVSSTANAFIREISGAQGAWNMDEASWVNDCATNTALDASGNSNHGKSCPAAGGTQPAAGKFGNAGVFDGGNDYVDAGNGASLNITNAITAEMWIKIPTDLASSQYLLWRAPGDATKRLFMYLDPGSSLNRLYFGTYDNPTWQNVYYNYSAYVGNWMHIVGTYDKNAGSNNMKLYINGIVKNQNTYAGDIPSLVGQNLLLGGIGGQFFSGSIDEVRIYNKALSQAEISDLYGAGGDRQGYVTTNYPNKSLVRKYSASVSAGAPSAEERGPGPVAYWQFDEGYGQTAHDSTINANNGTLGSTVNADDNDPAWQSEDMCVTGKCLKFDGSNDYVSMGDVNF